MGLLSRIREIWNYSPEISNEGKHPAQQALEKHYREVVPENDIPRVTRADSPSLRTDALSGQTTLASQNLKASSDLPDVQKSSEWFMPTYDGRNICDWGEEIAHLKREGDLETALNIAVGCMNSMAAAAEKNHAVAMEYYVIEVAKIQHKMKEYADEAHMIQGWFKRNIPAPREDYRIDLRKRLAKAQELWAKQDGRDPAPFHAEWKRLVELSKARKETGGSSCGISSGQSAVKPNKSRKPSRRRSSYIPDVTDLLIDDFVTVDFETANDLGGESACQIALIRMREGEVIDRYSTLLKPPPGYDLFQFSYLHGIRARHVKNAPMWPDIVVDIQDFVGSSPVYAHNASFDARVWHELDDFFETNSKPSQFYCTYRLSKQLLPGLDNYKLPTVADACAPRYRLKHHRADSDAEACALIVAALQRIVSDKL